MEKDDLIRRAMAGFFREKLPGDMPASGTMRTIRGLQYIVLRSGAGQVVAIFRLKNDGFLRRMRRPPKALLD
jgi:hypothetical protein